MLLLWSDKFWLLVPKMHIIINTKNEKLTLLVVSSGNTEGPAGSGGLALRILHLFAVGTHILGCTKHHSAANIRPQLEPDCMGFACPYHQSLVDRPALSTVVASFSVVGL